MVLDGNSQEKKVYNEPDIIKAKNFVDSLLSGTGLQSGSPIICEKIVVRFLEKNASGLEGIFRNTGLYPAMGTDQALELVYHNLYGRISENVLPVINRFIENTDFSFLDKISGAGTVSDEFRKEKLHDFVQLVFRNRSARFRMNGVYNIFFYKILEKYTAEIFRRMDFLYQKIFSEQKIAVNQEELIISLKVLLLIKNGAYMNTDSDTVNTDKTLRISNKGTDREKRPVYIDSMKKHIISFLPGFPDAVIDLAVKSNLPDNMTDNDEYICKFLFIINDRFQNYENIVKPDRGAESPDKSWFNIVGKNPAYYGYNSDVIKSLHLIAGEKNW